MPASAATTAVPKWGSHVELIAKPGDQRSIGKLDFFSPLFQNDDTLGYLDFRGVMSSDPSKEGNFGAGIRHILSDGPFGIDSIVGVYGFFDASSSMYDNTFYQASGGVEWLTNDFELRVNGYLPDRRQYTISSLTSVSSAVSVAGTTAQKTTTTSGTAQIEQGLPGFDVEAGIRLPILDKGGLWLYGGYFDFARGDIDVSGPKFRVEMPIDDPFGMKGTQLTVGAEFQDDDVRGPEGFGLVRFRIPFSPASEGHESNEYAGTLRGIDRRMTSYVQRDNDIVAPAATVTTAVAATADVKDQSGQTINVYNVAQGASGDCSQAHPCSLATAQASAGVGDIFVLRDSGGNITETAPFVLSTRQQVVGGGDAGAASVTLSSGDQLSLSGLGSRATLNNTSATGGLAINPVVQLATNSTVAGVSLIGGDSGVRIDNADNTTLSDVKIDGSNGAGSGVGVYATGSHYMTFTNVDINNVTGSGAIGLRVEGGSSDVTMTGGSVKNTTSTGAGAFGMLFDQADNVSISGTTIDTLVSTSSSKFGIVYGGSSLTMNDVTIANVPQYGVLFNTDVNSVTMNNTTFTSVSEPLHLHNQNFTSLSGTGNTWNGSGGACTNSHSSGGPGITFTTPAQTCH
jgi:hypothetical protein